MEKETIGNVTAEENSSKTEIKKGAKPAPKRPTTKQLAINLVIKIAAVALGVWLMLTFVLGITINYGNNMHPAERVNTPVEPLHISQLPEVLQAKAKKLHLHFRENLFLKKVLDYIK